MPGSKALRSCSSEPCRTTLCRTACWLWAWVLACGAVARADEPYGSFSGDVSAKFIENDGESRRMELLDDFAYVDPRRKKWPAPKGSIIDGASIPRAFWTAIGGPFEGPYRRASVVHDVACVTMTEPSDDVHLMFYEACRCGGVGEIKAKLMYYAVYHFGPQWKVFKETKIVDGKSVVVRRGVRTYAAAPDEIDVQAIERQIAETKPSLQELRATKLDTPPNP